MIVASEPSSAPIFSPSVITASKFVVFFALQPLSLFHRVRFVRKDPPVMLAVALKVIILVRLSFPSIG